jgi:ABC-type antimicrobial peptide transport system permease subunit
VIGSAGVTSKSRLLASLLFGVSPNDPFSFGAVALVLLAVGILASYVPARRATNVDPLTALRDE